MDVMCELRRRIKCAAPVQEELLPLQPCQRVPLPQEPVPRQQTVAPPRQGRKGGCGTVAQAWGCTASREPGVRGAADPGPDGVGCGAADGWNSAYERSSSSESGTLKR
eukprot:2984744-Prymnesium_polylepis.1